MLDQAIAGAATATTVPAPGLGRRSPSHGHAPASGQSSQKVQHMQDSADTRRGETESWSVFTALSEPVSAEVCLVFSISEQFFKMILTLLLLVLK